jgi:hypothetical protein
MELHIRRISKLEHRSIWTAKENTERMNRASGTCGTISKSVTFMSHRKHGAGKNDWKLHQFGKRYINVEVEEHQKSQAW